MRRFWVCKTFEDMKIYAYIRVSTEMQTRDNQEYEIRRYCRKRGLAVSEWVSESVSGTIAVEKRQLGAMLERMEKKGLIVKRPSEEDKRSTIVALSEGTENYREVIEKVSLKIGEEYYRGIKPKEAERFEATLKKILDNLK